MPFGQPMVGPTHLTMHADFGLTGGNAIGLLTEIDGALKWIRKSKPGL